MSSVMGRNNSVTAPAPALYVGHYSWPAEVGNLTSGVVYQVQQDGRVYRLEPAPGNGRVQLIGHMTLIPDTLSAFWDACEAIYWDEITLIQCAFDADLTPVKPVSVHDLKGSKS